MLVEDAPDASFYHTGESQHKDYDKKSFRRKPKPIDREVIAWDMEGISLSGMHRPQHAVLYGCSREPDSPLVAEKLTTRDMLEYMIKIAQRYPYALHVGYAFRYDANMIIAGLSEKHIIKLWKHGYCSFRFDESYVWSIKWIPGKMFTVSRRPVSSGKKSRARVSLTIYDYSSFFGTAFLNTCEQILREDLSAEDREVIEHGKKARGNQDWEDMPEIRHYWEREIVLIQRVFEKFRDVMYKAGFALKEWYGPGALANYINATHNIRTHLKGVQTTTNMMPDEVHQASKHAFIGGRFELFKAGRVKGPIYAIDINSAYPYALSQLPSFSEGEWVHVTKPRTISKFGVYRINYTAPRSTPFEFRPMPLPFRDNRGMISYPNKVYGWYWSPEAAMVQGLPGADIIEGWEWHPATREKPWEFLQEMYDRRMRIGKKNLLSMPFKLGPNSLYGKYAQTVGWDQKKKLPPKSHALPVAGWVTSYCRAMLYSVIMQAPSEVVAVETDGIFTTNDPRNLNLTIGKNLGTWDYEEYDEILYVQSGMYHLKKDGEWQGVKSRGISKAEYPFETARDYVQSLTPGEEWERLTIETKPKFIGAGAALQMSAPLKAVMTAWFKQERKIGFGDTGKRIHVPSVCPECQAGESPWDKPHSLLVHSRSDGDIMSFPRRLPWEGDHTREVQEIRDKIRAEDDTV